MFKIQNNICVIFIIKLKFIFRTNQVDEYETSLPIGLEPGKLK